MPRSSRSNAGRRLELSDTLNDEWARIVADPRTTARMAGWPYLLARYGDAASLLDAVGRNGGLAMEEADRLLGELVRVAGDDVLAARVVLQRVLAGLVNAAVRRTAGRPMDRRAVFDDLVANAWLVIRSFPIERRPTKIAVNILRDAEYLTCVRPVRLRSSGELPAAFHVDGDPLPRCGLDGVPDGCHPVVHELVSLLSMGAEAGLRRRDLAMLGAVTVGGLSVAEVAERFRVTPRTVLNRRVRTTAALASLVAA
jgi:hypothetical protein